MPEHSHLLIGEPSKRSIALVMQVLKQRVSRRCRRKKKSANQMMLWDDLPRAFWQPRYYDFNVFSERKHIEKLRYMHRNPANYAAAGPRATDAYYSKSGEKGGWPTLQP